MNEKVFFKEENEELFWQYWIEYTEIQKAGPKYLRANIESDIFMSKNKGLFAKDKSFIYFKDNKVVGIVLMPIEKHGDYLTVTLGGYFISAPLFKAEVEKKLFRYIEDLAKENKIDKIMYAVDPLKSYKYNYLEKYNYLNTSFLSYFIDLEIDDLLRSCRKGHRCDLKKLMNNPSFKVFYIDKYSVDYNIHEEYRILHHKCSGRVARPKETFDYQYENLKQGNAVLFGLKYKDKNIAYSYFDFSHDKSVYSSGSDDPEYDKIPLYHILVFFAIKYLKKRGVKKMDTGQPSCPSRQIYYYPDDKQLNIAMFKRGFAGDYANSFRGVRYFSKKLFIEEIENFVKEYKNVIV